MALSIFADALPYSEIIKNYGQRFDTVKIAPLLPNVGYSSSLHWQLYCNKYPDKRGVFVDWAVGNEKHTGVKLISRLLQPLDKCGDLGMYTKKVLDRLVFRRNAFANIPFRFRRKFTEQGLYLFWDKNVYGNEEIFANYHVISQDEGHISFEHAISKIQEAISEGYKNIFFNTGFADAIGHTCARGDKYSEILKPYMEVLCSVIKEYMRVNPDESVIIVSDHGMSTINNRIDLGLETFFGQQSEDTYIAYSDSAIMCIWCKDKSLLEPITDFLTSKEEGHLLSEDERLFYGVTDRKFGDLIFNLKEGYVFENNWFGKSVKGPGPNGEGMHGFWPSLEAKDQLAVIMLINNDEDLMEVYNYRQAHELIKKIMQK